MEEPSMLTPAQATELQRIGVNNDGGISAKGARAAARSAAELRAWVSMWKKSVLVTFLLLLISWLGNGGLTAAVVKLALHAVNVEDGPIYDGAWCEYEGVGDACPVATGPAEY